MIGRGKGKGKKKVVKRGGAMGGAFGHQFGGGKVNPFADVGGAMGAIHSLLDDYDIIGKEIEFTPDPKHKGKLTRLEPAEFKALEEKYDIKRFKWVQTKGDDLYICAICMEDMASEAQVGMLKCEHIYHMECVVKWIPLSETCPLCRGVVEKA